MSNMSDGTRYELLKKQAQDKCLDINVEDEVIDLL